MQLRGRSMWRPGVRAERRPRRTVSSSRLHRVHAPRDLGRDRRALLMVSFRNPGIHMLSLLSFDNHRTIDMLTNSGLGAKNLRKLPHRGTRTPTGFPHHPPVKFSEWLCCAPYPSRSLFTLHELRDRRFSLLKTTYTVRNVSRVFPLVEDARLASFIFTTPDASRSCGQHRFR